jgi:hypothetical protein
MAEQFENNYTTQLNGGIDADDTTIVVDAAPTSMTGKFRIIIEDEIIFVGAVSGTSLTGCTRGAEGSTAAIHADNTPVAHIVTSESLKSIGETPDVLYAGQFTSSATTTVVTFTPTPGKSLVAAVYSSTRGCNSISQTNVTWTQRYTGNGNSRYFEVWTGVAAASPGTTATFNFTGSATQYCEIYEITDAPAFTTGTVQTTGTGSAALVPPMDASALTKDDWVIWGITQSGITSSYSAGNQPYTYGTATGGTGRGGIFQAIGKRFAVWSVGSSSAAYFGAIVKLS